MKWLTLSILLLPRIVLAGSSYGHNSYGVGQRPVDGSTIAPASINWGTAPDISTGSSTGALTLDDGAALTVPGQTRLGADNARSTFTADGNLTGRSGFTIGGTSVTVGNALRVNTGVTAGQYYTGSASTSSLAFSSAPVYFGGGETDTLASGSTYWISPPLPSAAQLHVMRVLTKVAGTVSSSSDAYRCGDSFSNSINVNVPSASIGGTVTTSTTTVNIPATNTIYCWYDSTAGTTPQAQVSFVGVTR